MPLERKNTNILLLNRKLIYKNFYKKELVKLRIIPFLYKKIIFNKSFLIILKNIYGFNQYTSLQLLRKMGYSLNIKLFFIKKSFLNKLKDFFYTFILIDKFLKKKQKELFTIKKNIGLIRNLRLIKGYPANGQRTHSNYKTVRKLFKNYND